MRRRDFVRREHSWQERAVFCIRECGRMYPTICGGLSVWLAQVTNRLDQGSFGTLFTPP